MYKRILLAYDGSREGLIALREGALLAKRCGAQVFLLSVMRGPPSMGLADGVNAGWVVSQMSAYKDLLRHGVDVLTRLGLKPSARLVKGEPTIEISRFADEIAADLIVLGHRRQNLLQRWWSGSTGAFISDQVDCSILIGRKTISDEAFEAELKSAALA